MNRLTRLAVAATGAVALAAAPFSAAMAHDHGRSGNDGGHHDHGLWLGGALVGAVVGLVTLPVQIVAAAANSLHEERAPPPYYGPPQPYYPPREYAPAPRYYAPPSGYYPPPPREYRQPDAYYAPPAANYAPPAGYYESPRGYAPPRPGYYDYPR